MTTRTPMTRSAAPRLTIHRAVAGGWANMMGGFVLAGLGGLIAGTLLATGQWLAQAWALVVALACIPVGGVFARHHYLDTRDGRPILVADDRGFSYLVGAMEYRVEWAQVREITTQGTGPQTALCINLQRPPPANQRRAWKDMKGDILIGQAEQTGRLIEHIRTLRQLWTQAGAVAPNH